MKLKAFNISLSMIATLVLASACISDPGVAKKRGLVKDFSVTNTTVGCNSQGATKLLVLPFTTGINDSEDYLCVSSCPAKTHLTTAAELQTIINDPEMSDGEKSWIENSSNVCALNVETEKRPTNQIDIKSDFCSCINGKSDIINDCTTFCANAPVSATPTLYLNTIMGADIQLNQKLGNLYNWCSVQLTSDSTQPQCFLSANDGINTIANIPVTINPGSNTLTANISQLSLEKTYILNIYEGKTGSNAQSKEIQIYRKSQTVDEDIMGALRVSPVSQYTCLSYGGSGNQRSYFVRLFYYFDANETPPPVPPAGGTNLSNTVCHDEQLHPGNDSPDYPRLELIPQHIAVWDKNDPRFVAGEGGMLAINKTIQTRLAAAGVTVNGTLGLFSSLPWSNRPPTSSTSSTSVPSLGFIMVPFADKSGKAFCPTHVDYAGSDPLFNILGEFMDDTEGVFLGEKEAETVPDASGGFKTIYGTMLVTESVLKKYGFYIENGLRIKVTATSLNTKTIYYYWPVNDSMDSRVQGDRKLFTVRALDALQGSTPTVSTAKASDKRLGCIPKS